MAKADIHAEEETEEKPKGKAGQMQSSGLLVTKHSLLFT
jgi:hypothetical protein